MKAPAVIRVLIVDDHRVVRAGIAAILAENRAFEVAGEAGSIAEALTLCKELRPDLVLLDLRLPDGSGVEACRRIKSAAPATKVVALTSFADEALVFETVASGADGYLLKDSNDQSLISSLLAVHAGGQVLAPVIAQIVLAREAGPALARRRDPLKALTGREMTIARLVTEGCTYKEIGARLGVAEKTVRNGVSLMLDKLGFKSRAQLIAEYTRRGAGGER
jgi:two-component system, NarL family, response regulator DevR